MVSEWSVVMLRLDEPVTTYEYIESQQTNPLRLHFIANVVEEIARSCESSQMKSFRGIQMLINLAVRYQLLPQLLNIRFRPLSSKVPRIISETVLVPSPCFSVLAMSPKTNFITQDSPSDMCILAFVEVEDTSLARNILDGGDDVVFRAGSVRKSSSMNVSRPMTMPRRKHR